MRDSSGILIFFGLVFAAIGAWFVYVTLQMDVTVANPVPSADFPARIVNAQLVQVQLVDCLFGVGAALIAALFLAAAAIVSAVQPQNTIT